MSDTTKAKAKAKAKAKTKLDVVETWFVDKYLIMEYSFEVHDKLRKLMKSDVSETEMVKMYNEETEKLFAGVPEPLSRRNTAYYIWGHLKNLVERGEKKRIFGLLENLDYEDSGFSDIKREFHMLILKYNVPNLLKSSYFRETISSS